MLAERFCMDAMELHMYELLRRSGDHYKTFQTLEACKGGSETLAKAREWPRLVAASCASEIKAMSTIEQKHDLAGRFDCIPWCAHQGI